MVGGGRPHLLLDVREEVEYQICHLPHSKSILPHSVAKGPHFNISVAKANFVLNFLYVAAYCILSSAVNKTFLSPNYIPDIPLGDIKNGSLDTVWQWILKTTPTANNDLTTC